jgi:hypothetical protein
MACFLWLLPVVVLAWVQGDTSLCLADWMIAVFMLSRPH